MSSSSFLLSVEDQWCAVYKAALWFDVCGDSNGVLCMKQHFDLMYVEQQARCSHDCTRL